MRLRTLLLQSTRATPLRLVQGQEGRSRENPFQVYTTAALRRAHDLPFEKHVRDARKLHVQN